MNSNLVRMSLWTSLAAAGVWGGALPAQELQGAAAALKQIASPAPPKKPEATDPVSILRTDLAAFRSGSLSPADSARSWLALADRHASVAKLPGARGRYGEGFQFKEILASLPPPANWNALAGAITTRYGTAKRSTHSVTMVLLGHLLTGNNEGAWKDAEVLRSLMPKAAQDDGQSGAYQLLELMDALAHSSHNVDRILKVLELRMTQSGGGYGGGGSIPDLVPLVGAAKAEKFLRRALLSPMSISLVSGSATKKLARKLALEMVSKVKAPPWALCDTLESGPLYLALVKRFPAKKEEANPYEGRGYSGEGGRDQARMYYLVSLIAAGKTAAASKIVAGLKDVRSYYGAMPMEAIQSLRDMGKSKSLYAFLHAELSRNPTLPLWHAFLPVASELGRTTEMVALVQGALLKKGIKAHTRGMLQERLYQALLAADKVDEGLAQMRKLVAASSSSADAARTYGPGAIGLQMARIGKLLNRDALVAEGLKIVADSRDVEEYGESGSSSDVARLLVGLNRTVEAETVLINALSKASARNMGEGSGGQGREELIELCGLYHRAGRHADVLALLDNAPNWFARDISDILALSDSRETPIGFMAAAANVHAGKTDAALAILESLLRAAPGSDRGFELFAKLRGEGAVTALDEVARQDRYEERPLIWKAYALLQAGRIEEAEKTVREAISIDPSDGEQGKGDRMRAYSILADIRDRAGDAGQAALFRGAVKAVRMSEDADDYVTAGLLTRAIAMFKESLTFFADAYCIQSRLAIQLAAEGRMEEAEVHYRRAYELMPDSFGRMESHCFGCEGVFQGAKAEALAEKVFMQIAAKTPNKPQVHYLIGYLRVSQGKHNDALVHLRKAVALDPLYINAWEKLKSLGDGMDLPQADIDAATINILRLDPQRRHSSPDLRSVGNLKLLWTEVEAARKLQAVPLPTGLYPLPASKPSVDRFEVQMSEELARSGVDFQTYMRMMGMGRSRNTYRSGKSYPEAQPPLELPGQVLADHRLVGAVAGLIDGETRRDDGL